MASVVNRQIDAHVGSRVRLRRKLLGMSQSALAKSVGLTFQQIQKYERGANRIGAGRLFQFSQALDVPVSFFFDDVPPELSDDTSRGSHNGGAVTESDQLTRRETLELVRAYYQIKDPVLRNRVRSLAKILADYDTEDAD